MSRQIRHECMGKNFTTLLVLRAGSCASASPTTLSPLNNQRGALIEAAWQVWQNISCNDFSLPLFTCSIPAVPQKNSSTGLNWLSLCQNLPVTVGPAKADI